MSQQNPQMAPKRGRMHPTLCALDAGTWTYSGWENDKTDAEDCFFDFPSIAEGMIQAMQHKQKVHEEFDKIDAEDWFLNDPLLFADKIETMKRKQQAHNGDRSHPDLVALDSTDWTYTDWETDKVEAEDCYFNYPDLVEGKIQAMQRKQKVHDDKRRYHPDLVALNNTQWTYSGWDEDEANAEDLYFNYPSQIPAIFETMRRKQKVHDGDRSHPDLATLDTTKWTYPDCQEDKADAEDCHFNYPLMVADKIQTMQKKQRVFDGNRSHSHLVALDNVDWTYNGWEKDKVDAEDCHFNYPVLVASKILSMKRKQEAHDASHPNSGSSSCPIVLVDSDNTPPQAENKRPNKRARVASRMPTKDTSSLCVVCLKAQKSHAFDDCGHRCVCENCSKWALTRQKPSCPYCSRPISSARACAKDESSSGGALIDLSNSA